MSHFFLKTKKHNTLQKGFTVIELMVTIAIVVLVTGLIMIQYSSFNNSVLMRNQAYLTAFDVREAQALAVSVKGKGSQFREEYGIYFDVTNPNTYLLFQDNSANGDHALARYNDDRDNNYQNDEKVGQLYRVDPRFVIKNICASSASRSCLQDDLDPTTEEDIDAELSAISISFRRPDFEASFYSPRKTSIQSAEIIFGTENGSITRSVIIYKTGQVSVD